MKGKKNRKRMAKSEKAIEPVKRKQKKYQEEGKRKRWHQERNILNAASSDKREKRVEAVSK